MTNSAAAVGIVALLVVPFTLTATAIASDPPPVVSREARIKDISSIEGIRDNQLVGYGIVVGLQGTGDSQQTTFPVQNLDLDAAANGSQRSGRIDPYTKSCRGICGSDTAAVRKTRNEAGYYGIFARATREASKADCF